MCWDLSADSTCGCLHIPMTGSDFLPVQSTWILECDVVGEDGREPGIDHSTSAIGGKSGTMDDFRSGESEAIGRARSGHWVPPICAVLRMVLSVAVCGGASRILSSSDAALVPFSDVVVEPRNHEGASLFVFGVERHAGGKGVGTTARGDVFGHTEI